MSRHREPKRGLPSVISGKLYEAIAKLHKKVVAHSELALTHEDYLNLFVAPELHGVATTAAQLFKNQYPDNSFEARVGGVELEFFLHGRDHPLITRAPVVQETADPTLVATVMAWTKQRIESGYEFGRVQRVLAMLDERCSTPEQVRFFFPGILTLCATVEDGSVVDTFAERIRTYHAPDKIPVLGPALLAACHQASGTIAMSQLMTDLPEATQPLLQVALCKVAAHRDPALGDIPCLI